MKELYLDIMEKALAAYDDARIREYIDEVRRDGLSEHGFPRLGANIGILMAYGRCQSFMPYFMEIMDICCDEMPKRDAANDFSIREVCLCLSLMKERGTLPEERIDAWLEKLAAFDPWKGYRVIAPTPDTPVGNWAAFGALSELVRYHVTGTGDLHFVDHQVSSQLLSLDVNGMYKDPYNPMVYDLVTRMLLTALLHFGYEGKHRAEIESRIGYEADLLTLRLQSVTGELPFGGRSNQMILTEPLLVSYLEMAAVRYKQKGDLGMAADCRAAAILAARHTLSRLNETPQSHVKNRYDRDSFIGCEGYAYFNKYMITVASNIYMGLLFADESIEPAPLAPALRGGFVAQTGADFHKVALSAGGYSLELDTFADHRYDGSGLGRVHKTGCPSALCLSVPFPAPDAPRYKTEQPNPRAMSLCSFVKNDVGAEGHYTLTDSHAGEFEASATFCCQLKVGFTLSETYTVSEGGVDITVSGHNEVGLLIPVFAYDGRDESEITVDEHTITVTYEGATCTYLFDGTLDPDYTLYYNRNGRYRVYRLAGRTLHVELEEAGHEA